MSIIEVLLFLFGFLAVLFVISFTIYTVSVRFRNSRSEKMMLLANKLKFDYAEFTEIHNSLKHFGIIQPNAWMQSGTNHVSGKIGNIQWHIFDYSVTIKDEGYPKKTTQTICYARVPSNVVPFSLFSQESRLSRLKGYRSVEVVSHPAFNKIYTLLSPSSKIKELFNEGVLKYISKNPVKSTVEAKNKDMIFYKENRLVPVDDVGAFLEGCRSFAEHLVSYAEIMKYKPSADSSPTFIAPDEDQLDDTDLEDQPASRKYDF